MAWRVIRRELSWQCEERQLAPAGPHWPAALLLAAGVIVFFLDLAFLAACLALLGIAWGFRGQMARNLTGVLPIEANAQLVARAIVRRKLCPSCGYSLRGLRPERDGCAVCPECGAAWRIHDQFTSLTTSPAQTTPSTGSPPNS